MQRFPASDPLSRCEAGLDAGFSCIWLVQLPAAGGAVVLPVVLVAYGFGFGWLTGIAMIVR